MGSEMCIRDSRLHGAIIGATVGAIVTLTIAPTVVPMISTCKRRRMTAPTAMHAPAARDRAWPPHRHAPALSPVLLPLPAATYRHSAAAPGTTRSCLCSGDGGDCQPGLPPPGDDDLAHSRDEGEREGRRETGAGN